MLIIWAELAIEQLDAIYRYIAIDSPNYALNMVRRIKSRCEQIELFPYSGRTIPRYPIDTVREIIIDSYRLIYRIHGNHIEIITVVHGAIDLF